MKYLIVGIILCLGFCFPSHGQISQTEQGDSRLEEELIYFINKVKNNYKNSSKYMVFVLRGIESDSAGNYCITVSFILNSFQNSFGGTSYFFKLKEDIVVVTMDRRFDESILDGFPLKKISDSERQIITNKLSGNYTYSAQTLLVCKRDNAFKSFFYDRCDGRLYDWSISSPPPGGYIMNRLEFRKPGKLLIPDEK